MNQFCNSLLALIFLMAGCLQGAEKPLIVGMELMFPPFEMRDEQGNPSGISVDLAQALGTQLGRPIEIQNLPFDGLIPALKTGRIDLIISSITATPERARSIDFSDPYLKTGLCLLVGIRSEIQSMEELDRPGRKIAVKKGTTGHIFAAAHLHSAEILVLDKESACVLEVSQGKADAFIYDQISVFKSWQKYETTTRALLAPFQQEQWAIGIRKGNDELRVKTNAFLAEFKASGGFERLGEKWLKEQKEQFRQRGLPFYF